MATDSKVSGFTEFQNAETVIKDFLLKIKNSFSSELSKPVYHKQLKTRTTYT